MATGRVFGRLAMLLGLACLLSASPLAAQGPCRMSLQLGLDVSGSVDSSEYRLQLDGLAQALLDPEVQAALLSMPQIPVAISVFEWSGRGSQRLVFDWKLMRNEADLLTLADHLRRATRREMSVSTGLGAAMLFAATRLSAAPACSRNVLDISGDGKNNDGPRPQDADDAALAGLHVNALIIGPNRPGAVGAQAREATELTAYFRAYVLRGPDAFVEVAEGYDDYAEAMKRKLLKELQVIVIGQAPLRFQN
ncbi:DUF1194 domain-containing protein [Tropicimonas sp. TH_r6]|uniref:DUF1194 domain-containing protein n=1 Tax=Tropicimonas sp. TH_r6 TaxID=3082085 RepID=UPI002955A720|nr:DUF1194 domain-containing protein [Tropicimonas sp. TH_r6]MDV7141921.1 DUF1194 domain-containing protein [Tropicimonas sp. TH_r6]